MDEFLFLSERSTDHWFVEQYDRLFPRPSEEDLMRSPFADCNKKFVIAFTPRVGSTLLCQQLIRYGVFVAEFLNPIHIDSETHITRATTYSDFFNRLVTTYALNGSFGLKAHVQATIPLFRIHEFQNHISDWRFVYITRENIVRQAISQVLAELRGSWASWTDPSRDVTDADYSHDRIARTIWSTRLSQESWERFFQLFNVKPFRITYEEISADPARAAARVARYCGLNLGGEKLIEQFDDPPLLPQTTVLNSVWERRFRTSDACAALGCPTLEM